MYLCLSKGTYFFSYSKHRVFPLTHKQLYGFNKKLVEAHTLADDDNEDTFVKGCALIRANLNKDPEKIKTEEEWARLYAQAIWLERWRNKNKVEIISALFGDGKH